MDYRFDFDDQLPDLPMAFDFDEVADLFERKVFNSSQEPVGKVNVKKLQDVKYRPSERCVTTYELIVDRPDSSLSYQVLVSKRHCWRSSRFVMHPACAVLSVIPYKRLRGIKCFMENPFPETQNGL
jgi:hypothetical protein